MVTLVTRFSVQLGAPGDFASAEFLEASGKIEAAAKKHKKALCCIAGSPDAAHALFGKGYEMICYSGDVWLYQNALREGIELIRNTP